MSGTLLVAGVIALTAGLAYGYVARSLPRPAQPRDSARALRMFSLWWYALALNISLVGITYLLGGMGLLTFEVQFVDSYLQRLLLCVSMIGLMHYLLFLITGRDLLRPIVVVYAAYFFLLTYGLLQQRAEGLFIGAWRTDLVFANPDVPWLRFVSLGAILLPPVVCSLWYLRLFFTVDDPTRRWRIALISFAILLWWGVAVAAGQRAALDDSPLQVANRLLSLLAAFAALAAYSPPTWAQRRWGIERAHPA